MLFTNIVAWIAFVYWQLYNPTKKDTKWYIEERPKINLAPPGSIFGIAWTILYGLIVATAVTYFKDDTQVAVFSLFVTNIVLNKLWTMVFFRGRNTAGAMFIIVLMFGTELSIAILFGINGNWLQFGLYLPYLLWTMFAFYLNARMHSIKQKKKQEFEKRKRKR